MTDIAYQAQDPRLDTRGAGAACLAMVYGALGSPVRQAEIFPAISAPTIAGPSASAPAGTPIPAAYRMVADAQARGFAALAIQAADPLAALRLCQTEGLHAILNMRLQPDQSGRHFAVLAGIDADAVSLHDPYFGDFRRLAPAELLALWRPGGARGEIAGNLLIAIAADPAPRPVCTACATPIPGRLPCPRCRAPIALRPAALLGCLATGCRENHWVTINCPSCDYLWAFRVPATRPLPTTTGAANTDAASAEDSAASGDQDDDDASSDATRLVTPNKTADPASPQAAAPQTASPQTASPQTAAPQTAAPQTAAPQAAAPQAAAPQAAAPQAAPATSATADDSAMGTQPAATAQSRLADAISKLDLSKVQQSVTDFVNRVRARQSLAADPRVAGQLALIEAALAQIAPAAAANTANLQRHADWLDGLAAQASTVQGAAEARAASLLTAPPPLDGDALAMAVLARLQMLA